MPKFISDEEMDKLDNPLNKLNKKILTDEEMNNLEKVKSDIINQGIAAKDAYSKAGPIKPSTRKTEAALTGLASGATFGFSDELQGGLGALERAAKYLSGSKAQDSKSLMDALRTGYMTERDTQRALQKELETQHPGYYAGGQIASSLPTMAASAPLGLVKAAAVQGGLQGLGSGEGSALEQLKSTALGAGTGALVTKGVQSGTTALKNILANTKTTAALRGLGASSGTINKLQNPKAIANEAFEAGLVTPLKSITDLNEAAKLAKSGVGETLGNIRRTSNISYKPEEVLAILEKTRNPNLAGLDIPGNTQLDKIKQNILQLGKTGSISQPALAEYSSELGSQARKGFADVSVSKEAIDAARKALTGIENISAPRELLLAKKQYSNLADIGKITKKAAESSKNLDTITGTLGLGTGLATGSPISGAIAALIGTPEGRRKLMMLAAQGANIGGKILKPLDSEKLANLSQILGRFSAQKATEK